MPAVARLGGRRPGHQAVTNARDLETIASLDAYCEP
jgi:hypothetical protein